MSYYVKTVNFAVKDSLLHGDPAKVVKGAEIDNEYNNVATASATKTDNAAALITGGSINGCVIGNATPAAGTFTTATATSATITNLAVTGSSNFASLAVTNAITTGVGSAGNSGGLSIGRRDTGVTAWVAYSGAGNLEFYDGTSDRWVMTPGAGSVLSGPTLNASNFGWFGGATGNRSAAVEILHNSTYNSEAAGLYIESSTGTAGGNVAVYLSADQANGYGVINSLVPGTGAAPLVVNTGGGQVRMGGFAFNNTQSNAALSVRQGNNGIEFGHQNPAGYGSNIGAENTSGKPFVAFNCELGSGNTYTTRGIKGVLMQSDLIGDLVVSQVPTASAANQTPAAMALIQPGAIAVGPGLSSTMGIADGLDGRFAFYNRSAMGNVSLRITGPDSSTTDLYLDVINGNTNTTEKTLHVQPNGGIIQMNAPSQGSTYMMGGASGVASPSLRMSNNQFISWLDNTSAYTNAGFLWCDASNNMVIGAGNSTRIAMPAAGGTTVTGNLTVTGTITGAVAAAPLFTSPEQTIVNNTKITWAHGLGRKPYLIRTILRCKILEASPLNNWAVGEEVELTQTNNPGNTTVDSSGTSSDATNVYYTNMCVCLTNNGWGLTPITVANWKIVFCVW